MKILQINCVYNQGSTGKIVESLKNTAAEAEIETEVICGQRAALVPTNDVLYVQSKTEYYINNIVSRFLGNEGANFSNQTRKMLKLINPKDISLIHLHNLHGHYIHSGVLFEYIKEHSIPVVWTLHDCWAFTGHCPYFDLVKCDKWIKGCEDCKQKKSYPQAFVDRSAEMYRRKKEWFMGVDNLTIVTPSNWLAEKVRQSFLHEYPLRVINNGIDLEIFSPRQSDFRKKNRITENKFVVLGVAFGWGQRKGLDVFIRLAKRLNPEKFQIVLVGTTDDIDKQLPTEIVSIHRTQNQIELAEIYSAADVFVNPTREDNYPTVNMEAIACGTPVVTFQTGGSPEMLDGETGSVVKCDDIDALECEILRIYEERPFKQKIFAKRAADFDKRIKFNEYIELYKEMLH